MRPRLLVPPLLLLLTALGAARLLAHDFWLASSAWRAHPGAIVTVTANVGDRFPRPTGYTAPERVASLRLFGPAGEIAIAPQFRRDVNSLAADVPLPVAPATYLAVMVIKPRFIEIPAADFKTYLTHEGLERVIAERERLGEAAKAGRERYSRYSKLLIRAGDEPSDHVTRPAGLPAELVPLADPTRLTAGGRLVVQLLFSGRPVEGALVGAIDAASTGAPDEWPLKGRTDANGRVELHLAQPGPWLIRTVHMVRRTGETGPEAVDWESYWASLTFDLAR